MRRARRGTNPRATVLLTDLDPQRDVRGGAGKKLFGEPENAIEAATKPGLSKETLRSHDAEGRSRRVRAPLNEKKPDTTHYAEVDTARSRAIDWARRDW